MSTSPNSDPSDLERRIDALFAVPLADFIATRKALATELRKAGNDEGATRVKALFKPTVAAWAINSAVHGAPELFEHVMEAGEEVRRAQIDGLGAGALQDATRARRAAVTELLAHIEATLRDAGEEPTRATLDRIARNVEALAAYGRDQPTPTAGRLVGDVDPPGFEALAGVALARPRRPEPEPEPEPPAAPEARPPLPGAAAEVPPTPHTPDPAEVLAALERRRDELRTRAGEADQALATARRTAESLAQQAARARERAGELETQARELRDAADRASAELESAGSGHPPHRL